jgi:hypothetical protein
LQIPLRRQVAYWFCHCNFHFLPVNVRSWFDWGMDGTANQYGSWLQKYRKRVHDAFIKSLSSIRL